ncbi:hypothetical protein LB521_27680 [Mesorhizobium sp. BR-1-1-8]|uniref:hypothetical protein n=1 Tax=Mesorhizobium sp. BR-1-1-8 TaxID=2876659 RepID=UPI001CCE45B3|nr:hypothetical protein [Mesorhizobium sp. BR-1-1-8]MBZ9984918.1 hypothetical protein [Mesorhizobium sp. BR-1-1-8]
MSPLAAHQPIERARKLAKGGHGISLLGLMTAGGGQLTAGATAAGTFALLKTMDYKNQRQRGETMNSLFWWTGALVWSSAIVAGIGGLAMVFMIFAGGDDPEQKRADLRIPLDTLD